MQAKSRSRLATLEAVQTDPDNKESIQAILRFWETLAANDEYLDLRWRALLPSTPAAEAKECNDRARQLEISIARANGEHELVEQLQSFDDSNLLQKLPAIPERQLVTGVNRCSEQE